MSGVRDRHEDGVQKAWDARKQEGVWWEHGWSCEWGSPSRMTWGVGGCAWRGRHPSPAPRASVSPAQCSKLAPPEVPPRRGIAGWAGQLSLCPEALSRRCHWASEKGRGSPSRPLGSEHLVKAGSPWCCPLPGRAKATAGLALLWPMVLLQSSVQGKPRASHLQQVWLSGWNCTRLLKLFLRQTHN